MKIASVADVKARLSAYLDQCEANGPVIITRNGRAVAVLVAPEDDDDLERIVMARSRQLQAILHQSRQSIAAGKGLTEEALWKAVGQRQTKRSRSSGTGSGRTTINC